MRMSIHQNWTFWAEKLGKALQRVRVQGLMEESLLDPRTWEEETWQT